MKGDNTRSTVLMTEKLHIENKTLFIDLRENEGGQFIQIAELSNDRRSTVVIPFTGSAQFLEALGRIANGALMGT